jgi:hypothetical protein
VVDVLQAYTKPMMDEYPTLYGTQARVNAHYVSCIINSYESKDVYRVPYHEVARYPGQW